MKKNSGVMDSSLLKEHYSVTGKLALGGISLRAAVTSSVVIRYSCRLTIFLYTFTVRPAQNKCCL